MFQAQTRPAKQLQVIQGGKEHHRTLKGVSTMKTNMTEYRFAEYPSNSSVASGVTLLVSAWFLVAAGAILADPSAPTARQDLRAQTATVTVAQLTPAPRLVSAMAGDPDTHFTITVEAKRLKV